MRKTQLSAYTDVICLSELIMAMDEADVLPTTVEEAIPIADVWRERELEVGTRVSANTVTPELVLSVARTRKFRYPETTLRNPVFSYDERVVIEKAYRRSGGAVPLCDLARSVAAALGRSEEDAETIKWMFYKLRSRERKAAAIAIPA